MDIYQQIANINAALEKEIDSRKRGFMRLQLQNLEYRLNKLKR